MRDRIKRDIQRSDVDVDIKESIRDAISHFQDEPLWVNSVTTTISTTATAEDSTGKGSAYYDLPTEYSSDLYVSLDDNTVITQLTKLTYQELDDMDTVSESSTSGPFEGVPSYWCFDGPAVSSLSTEKYETSRIRLYPRPQAPKYSNAAGAATVESVAPYTIRLRYTARIPKPDLNDADGFANFWFNEAERMIRCYAKGLLYADVLQQFDLAQAQEKMAELEYNRLITKTESRAFFDAVRPAGV